jgi:hypothetical protein
MEIRPVGAELFHANRRTDMTKLTVYIRNISDTPKMKTSDYLIFRTYVMYVRYTLIFNIILSVIDKPKHIGLTVQENTYSNL